MINTKEWIKILYELKQILDKADIKYWLDLGTLLGAVRSGKFIPWDTDIDLGITYEGAKKVMEKIPDLEKCGFRVGIRDFSIGLSKSSVAIGLCVYRFKKNKAWTLYGTIVPIFDSVLKYFYLAAERLPYRNLYTEHNLKTRFLFFVVPPFVSQTLRKFLFKICTFFGQIHYIFVIPKFYFENLKEIVFYNMRFNVPFPTEKYLLLYYGKNWKKPQQNWHREIITKDRHPKNTKTLDYNFFEKHDRSKYSLI